MDQYQESNSTWDKLADLYQEKFMDLDIYNDSYDQFCDTVSEHGRVLDIGCGPGNTVRYLLSKRSDLMVTAIDMAPNMVALAQKNNPTAVCKVMDTRKLHEISETYDGILAGFVVPYLSESDVRKFIADSRSLLNNQGTFYISFVEGDPIQSGFKCRANGDRIYFYYHSLSSIQACLAEEGFKPPTVLHVNYQRSEMETELHTILLTQLAVSK